MSSASATRFLTAIGTWVNAITTSVKTGAKPLINEQVNLAAGQAKTYNLAALLGATASNYDLGSATIQVLLLDTDVGSATKDYFVNAETIVRIGIRPNGSVIVQNYHTDAVTVRVRISYPARNN